MAIHSLRPMTRPDNIKNQVRASQSLARKLYLAALLASAGWIGMLVFGPMVFLDADGMVVQTPEELTPAFSAQVIDVAVRPGDHVAVGQSIGHVLSTQMLDLISDLTSKRAQFDTRDEQIKARLAAIEAMLPAAEQRVREAEVAMASIGKALARGYSTTARAAEATRERYDALREVASVKAEQAGLVSEQALVRANRQRFALALDKAQRTYDDGTITSPVEGTVGTRVATPGTVLAPGDHVAEIHHGTKYVLAYFPTNRLYSAAPGQEVVVTDGVNRQIGHLERIQAIADQLPAEFQTTFRSVERKQLARISLDGDSVFPLLSKIKATSPGAPSNLLAAARVAVTDGLTSGANWMANRTQRLANGGAAWAAEPVRK
ncbi:multidrug resistance efflux pump [Bradyrhizobium sp. USDA 4011]